MYWNILNNAVMLIILLDEVNKAYTEQVVNNDVDAKP